MGSSAAPDRNTRTRIGSHFPAYGPVDAVLGFALFYVVVDRATPTVVDVFTNVLPGVSPSAIRLWLAIALWFVLIVTLVDQMRRQLAALGILTHEAVRPNPRSRSTLSESQALAYLVIALVGGVLAAWTYGGAIDAVVALLPAVADLDVEAVASGEFVLVLVFFVSFGVATHALDRLLIGGIRAILTD